jgi:hypothetical protein
MSLSNSTSGILNALAESVIITSHRDDAEPLALFINDAARASLAIARDGSTVELAPGVPLASVLPPRGDLDIIEEIKRTALTGLARRGTQVWRSPDGAAHTTIDYSMSSLDDGSVLWSFRDISESVRTAVSTMTSVHDSLTGLPSRQLLRQRLMEAQRRRLLTGRKFAVVFADLDGMRSVNNSYGHLVGD